MYLSKCFLQASLTLTVAGARSSFVVPANEPPVVAYLCLPKQIKELHMKVITSKYGLSFSLLLKTVTS